MHTGICILIWKNEEHKAGAVPAFFIGRARGSPNGCDEGHFRGQAGSLLSFITLMKDISIGGRVPFVLLNSPKRHFEHYPSRFCPFKTSKRTFLSLHKPLLSF